eukprot:TRINITY_DN75_c0_g1_i1.p1 TRINITY_DN75_c0_g1~~TRINITY_DN75_c0_g1_i1.p1  ORF type:complete len:333 (-),score=67.09 TRINITY_DN75_c0_g1_i1:58-1056(-)
MKASLVVVLVFVGLVAAKYSYDWNQWKAEHGKNYATPTEEARRQLIFNQNLGRIDALNNASRTAQFAMNKFGDLSPEEFKATYLSKVPAVRDPTAPVAPLYPISFIQAIPASFDWRTKGAVTPVKNQGQCGSCWAFSAIGNIEGQWFLSGKTLVGLSEQNLVDCDHHCIIYDGQKSCDQGCEGGLQPNAYEYIIGAGGVDTEASYPYEAVDDTCRFSTANIGAKISNYTMVSTDENQMAAYLYAHGPVAIAVDATVWQFYFFGILDVPCGTSLDHGVLIVGYGSGEDPVFETVDFWNIKNSWGSDWGEEGYIRIERGVGECGCNLYASSSIV